MPGGILWPNDPLNPDWSRTERVHSWHNYIGDKTRAIWHTLTDEQKLAIAEDADEQAENEYWD
mgnify:CR=1 FL=1